MKCIICEKRPAKDKGRCPTCEDRIAANNGNGHRKPEKYVVYRGNVLGFFRQPNGRLRPEPVRISPDNLPKRDTEKVLRLDRYIVGLERRVVKELQKAFKRQFEPRVQIIKV